MLTHRGTGSIETTKSEDVCGPSGSTRVSLEKGKPVLLLFYFFLHFFQGDDETGSRDIGRQVDRPEDTDWLSLL